MPKSKPISKKASTSTTKNPRVRKLTRRQKRACDKKKAQNSSPLIGSFRLTGQTVMILRRNWKILGGIVLVYLVLNIIFASGISNLNSTVNDIKNNLNGDTSSSTFGSALSGFSGLVASSGTSSSPSGSILQSMLIVLESLVIIFTLRLLLAGRLVSVKQAYYNSTAQLVPFLLVMGVIILQLIPLAIGSSLAAVVFTSSSGAPIFIFSLIFAVLAGWSFYLLVSSVFALYIVTLPNMQPLRALRSAKNLVRFRRWSIMRRLLFLPILVLAIMCAVVVPLIMVATVLVAPVFYALSMLSILFVHTYLYSLYRGLL